MEEEVGHGVSGEMLRHGTAWREDEPFGSDFARVGFPAQIRARLRVGLEQPQYASRKLRQQPHPDREHVGKDLVARVEAAEHEARVGQPALRAGRRSVDGALAVPGKIAVRQEHEALGEIWLLFWRCDER